MNEAQLLGLLGLSLKSGRLLWGTGRVVDALRGGENLLVMLDESASPNTRKRVLDTCSTHGRDCAELPQGLLESATGKTGNMVAGLKPGGLRDKVAAAILQDNRLLCAGTRKEAEE